MAGELSPLPVAMQELPQDASPWGSKLPLCSQQGGAPGLYILPARLMLLWRSVQLSGPAASSCLKWCSYHSEPCVTLPGSQLVLTHRNLGSPSCPLWHQELCLILITPFWSVIYNAQLLKICMRNFKYINPIKFVHVWWKRVEQTIQCFGHNLSIIQKSFGKTAIALYTTQHYLKKIKYKYVWVS